MILRRLKPLVDEHPDRLAIDDGQHALSYRELDASAEALLGRLTDRVVVASVLPGGPTFTAAHLAAIEAGAAFMPLSHRATVLELTKAFDLVGPHVVVYAPACADAVREALDGREAVAIEGDGGEWRDAGRTTGRPAAPAPHDAAMVQFTSGSTGTPKGVLLSAGAIGAGIDANASFLERFRGEAVFSPMPQFHAMGGAVVLEHLAFGASVLLALRFVPGDDKRRIEKHGARLLISNPSYQRMLLRLGMLEKLSSVRALSLGSAASEPALLQGIRSARSDLAIHLRYGLSEAFGSLTRLDIEVDAPLPPAGLVGPPLGGAILAPLNRLDEGEPKEVKARTAAAASAAIVGPGDVRALVDEHGFLPTGDLGFYHDDGLHLRGRLSQFLKRNGHRIDPGEIEQALVAHPAIVEAAVAGLPDPLAGSKIVAMVEVSAGGIDFDAHCRTHLSDHKIPQEFVTVDKIPRTAVGKTDRERVRAQLLNGVRETHGGN